ncbi:MAG: zinc finger domain-containing protein [Candidatus Pacearchaeota archaeon]
MKCVSCGKNFVKGVCFICPECGKRKIARCFECKKLNVTYKCECGFQGP